MRSLNVNSIDKGVIIGVIIGIIITGVVLLPVRFFVDGRLDVRPLADEDKAHIPLPYEDKTITDQKSCGNGAYTSFDFTVADWGTDKNFYIDGMSLNIALDGLGTPIAANKGLHYYIMEIENIGEAEEIITIIITGSIKISENWHESWKEYIRLNTRKIDSNNTLRIQIFNGLGVDEDIDVFVNGMAI